MRYSIINSISNNYVASQNIFDYSLYGPFALKATEYRRNHLKLNKNGWAPIHNVSEVFYNIEIKTGIPGDVQSLSWMLNLKVGIDPNGNLKLALEPTFDTRLITQILWPK